MKQSRLAAFLTIVLMALGLGALVAQRRGWSWSDLNPRTIATSLTPKTKSPEDAIYSMLDASRAGNTKAYLDAYTGQLHDQLRQSIADASSEKFVKYLQDTNAAIQGVALALPESTGPNSVKVRTEYIFKDRNEVQMVHLQRQGGDWKIYRVDGAERGKTLVPYGTAVTD